MQVRLYEFFKAYNNDLVKGKNIYYARGISEANGIIKESFMRGSREPVDEYIYNTSTQIDIRGSSWRSIPLNFLQNFLQIYSTNYNSGFSDLNYLETRISIERSMLNTTRRVNGLQVLIECLIDVNDNKLIILAFGKNYNLDLEASIIKGLLTEFNTEDNITTHEIEQFTYWELTKGHEETINFNQVNPISRNSLIEVANRLVNNK
ncbi:hypothetical protein [Clostridium sp. BSD9I1]|uniref:hypothetical protein n=1 Tax=Clostridium sp. BSD9I1 TaxID=2003589 RepID=UPI001648D43E|nr:hypothetical protein [Clostridium sp. BSD9I1]